MKIIFLISIIGFSSVKCLPAASHHKASHGDGAKKEHSNHTTLSLPDLSAVAKAANLGDDFACACRPIAGESDDLFNCKCRNDTGSRHHHVGRNENKGDKNGTDSDEKLGYGFIVPDEDGEGIGVDELFARNIDSGVTVLPAGGKATEKPTPFPDAVDCSVAEACFGLDVVCSAPDVCFGKKKPDTVGEVNAAAPGEDIQVLVKCFKDNRKPGGEPTGEILNITDVEVKIKGKWLKHSCTLGSLESFNVTESDYKQMSNFCKSNGFDVAMPLVNRTTPPWYPFEVDQKLMGYFREHKLASGPTFARTVEKDVDAC